MAREQMHPIYSRVPMRSWTAVLQRFPEDESWQPELETVMIALAVDPDEAADLADLMEFPAKNKVKWPDHGLKAFTRAERSANALETVAQWSENRKHFREEEDDEIDEDDLNVLRELVIPAIIEWDRKLGSWCTCKLVRWAIERFAGADDDAKATCLRAVDLVEGSIVKGTINRAAIDKMRESVESLSSKPSLGSFAYVIPATVSCLNTTGENLGAEDAAGRVVFWIMVAANNSPTLTGISAKQANRQMRKIVADACRSFPVRVVDQGQFAKHARPRKNPSDTQALRSMIEGDRGRGRDEDITDFFGLTEQQARKLGDTIRRGLKTNWVGGARSIVQVDPDYVRAVPGNIFYPDKLAAVADAVESGQRPTFVVGYADVTLIDKTSVEEDRELFESGELMSDRPFEESDIGKLKFQIRDGNHRVFGALIGGETKVWVDLEGNRLQEVNEYREAKKAKKLAEYKKAYGPRYVKMMVALDKLLRAS